MTLLFWLSLATIVYTYAGYPLVIALLAHLHPLPRVKAPWTADAPPVSVVMAVHNGAAILLGQLTHLLTLEPHLINEVIVVCDGSTDATPAILAQTKRPRLRTIFLPQRVGKSAALNHGVAAAASEIILFVDIRPRIQPGAVAALLSNFADPSVGCVAGELLLNALGHDPICSAVTGLYWRYERWIRNCEAAVDSLTGVSGCFYAIRRALAKPAPAGLILDDMFLPLSILRQGYRCVLDRSALVTDTWPASATSEFRRKVRTLAGNFQLVAEAPWLLTSANRILFQLVSHKLLRLLVPYCFILLLLSAAILGLHSTMYLAFVLLQAAFWLMAAASLKLNVPGLQRLAAPAGALLVLNAAAIAGFFAFLFTRGPLWKIWTPTAAPLFEEEA
jgi:cellulose synthase/poly-beta-1,6-N-acetylglucosamine synthase-like glycosyltransferase